MSEETSDIRVVYLDTGDLLITQKVSCSEHWVTVQNPYLVKINEETGDLDLIDWNMLSKIDSIEIDRSHVVYIQDQVDTPVAEAYESALTSPWLTTPDIHDPVPHQIN